MKKYRVLWIDDVPSEEFINEAFEFGLEIEVEENLNAGMATLMNTSNEFDAIILDANCRVTNDVNEKPSLYTLTESIYEIDNYCTKSRLIPWFVYTGGGYEGFENISIQIHSKRDWDEKKERYYNKPIDRYELFENIKSAVNKLNSIEWKVWNDYHDIFDIFNNKSSFLALDHLDKSNIFKVLIDLQTSSETINTEHFNVIRGIFAGGIAKTLLNMGVIPEHITELNKKSKHLCNEKFREHIPIHVQRSIHLLVNTCQDGSHNDKECVEGKIPPQVIKLVSEGKARYLFTTVVYSLLNVLEWLNSFILNFGDKEKNKEFFTSQENVTKRGNVSRRPNDLHAFLIFSSTEKYYISRELVSQFGLSDGDIVEAEIGMRLDSKTGTGKPAVVKIIK